MAETQTEKKITYTYDEEIKYNQLNLDNSIDGSKLPTYIIENCEVGYSSLAVPKPEYGHSVQIILPDGSDFIAQDRDLRKRFAEAQAIKDPNVETFASMVKIITASEAQKKKLPESFVNRGQMFFQITNKKLKDVKSGKYIAKASDATGDEVQVIYFAKNDQFTGEAFQPDVYRYNDNGQKVKTFVSSKDGKEKNLILNQGDLVNIKIRAYASHNSKDKTWSLKYNLLEVQIVKTKYELGGGGSSNYKAEGPDLDVLSSVFGITETVQPEKAKKATSAKIAKEEVKVNAIPEEKVEEVKTETTATTSDSAIANALSSLNAGLDLASLGIGNVGGASE